MRFNKLRMNFPVLIGICLLGLTIYFGYLGSMRIKEFGELSSELHMLENKKVATQWQSFESKGEVERFVAKDYRQCLDQGTSQSTCRANTVLIAQTKYGSNFGVQVLDSIDRQDWAKVKLSATDENRITFLINRMTSLVNQMTLIGV